jgi:hypothetical protein
VRWSEMDLDRQQEALHVTIASSAVGTPSSVCLHRRPAKEAAGIRRAQRQQELDEDDGWPWLLLHQAMRP